MRTVLAVPLFLGVLFSFSFTLSAADQPTDLKAVFRSGQTFITFKESGAVKYNLYRADKKITDVKAAKLIATVGKGSSAYPLEAQRKVLAGISGKPGYGERYIIEDNPDADPAKMLPSDVGLFVYTPHDAGKFCYAVTALDAEGKEESKLGGANSLATPVAEKQEPIGAVLVFKADLKDKDGKKTGEKRVYTHWMDAAEWNGIPDGGCAYNFGVGVPDNKKPKGIVMFFHGYSGYYGDQDPCEGMVAIRPGDPFQTWFYGYKDPSGKKVVNYTERRILLTMDTVIRLLKSEGIEPNVNKIYTHGTSMGGTAGNMLGAFDGDIFCAVLASKGAVDHNRNGKWTGTAEQQLWGTRAENLPASQGDKVWDHQNFIKWHLDNIGKETAFLMDGHASNDESVPFDAVPDYYDALQKARRPFAAVWEPCGHGGFLEPRWPNHRWWGTFQFNKDETVPAIGNASSNDDPRKAPKGQINLKIEWCSRENDFDPASDKDNARDEPGVWEMTFRSKVDAQTADITPRRCQKFKAVSNKTYAWENLDFSDPKNPKLLDKGTVNADKYGLVTIEKFKIGNAGWGNRLVIKDQAGGSK